VRRRGEKERKEEQCGHRYKVGNDLYREDKESEDFYTCAGHESVESQFTWPPDQ
jgi:hypothetical protein